MTREIIKKKKNAMNSVGITVSILPFKGEECEALINHTARKWPSPDMPNSQAHALAAST